MLLWAVFQGELGTDDQPDVCACNTEQQCPAAISHNRTRMTRKFLSGKIPEAVVFLAVFTYDWYKLMTTALFK